MGPVAVQARADLRSRPAQVALLGLVVAVAAVLLTLGVTGIRLSTDAYDRLFHRTDGAHLWLYLDDELVTAADAEAAVDRVPGVVARTPAMADVPLGLVGVRQPSFGSLAGREWAGDGAVARVEVVRGRPPAAAHEVLLDANVGRELGLGVGDEVAVARPGGKATLRVVGLEVSAENCPYPLCNPTVVYLAPGALPAIGLDPADPATGANLAVGARLRDPQAVEAARDAATRLLPPGAVEFSGDWRRTRQFAGLVFGFQAGILVLFSGVAMLVAGVLMAVAIGGAVRAETGRIGILKAVGFTGRQLRRLYLLEYLGPTVVAAAVGSAAAAALAPAVMGGVAAPFGDRAVDPPLVLVALVPVAFAAVAAVFVVLPVRRAVRMDAVAAIRGTAGTDRARRPGRLASLARPLDALVARLPVPVARGVGDARAVPGRSALVAAGLAVAAVAMTFAVVANGATAAFLSDPEVGAQPDADLLLRRAASFPVGEAIALAKGHPSVEAVAAEHMATVQFPDDATPHVARFRTGDADAFRWPVLAGRPARGPDEVLVGFGLARQRGLGPGDRFTLLAAGRELRVRVAGVFRDMSNMGETLVVPAGLVPERDLFPATLLVKVAAGASPEAVGDELGERSGGLFDPLVVDERLLPGMVRSMRGTIARLLGVLAALSALGVLSSVLLGVRERRRSLGLLKAVGMTPAQVATSVVAGTVALGLVGAAVGIPVGVVSTRVSLDAVLRALGFGPFTAPADPAALGLVVPVVLAIAAVGAWVPARLAGWVPVVDTLRYE